MADRGGNDDGGHWWNRGPLHEMQQNHPWIANGLKYGGIYGGAAGAVAEGLGRLGDWISSRGQDNLASMSNDRQQPDYSGGTNWDVSLGDPQSAGVRSGPPSDLAGGGGGTLSQFQPEGDGSAPPWYEDTTMDAADPMGLVPNYTQDEGDGGGGRGIFSPSERRDAPNGWGPNSGISNMQVGGQNVIIGQDPNQMYVRRLVDFG